MTTVNGTTVSAKPGFVPTAGSSSYDGRMVRLATLGNALPGLFERGHLAATQRAAGANQSLDIAGGQVYVDPRTVAFQGVYLADFPAATNTSTDHGIVWPASDATNPRVDLLCVEVQDEDFSGSFTGARLVVITGTPAAGAVAGTQVDPTYWPSIPTGLVPIVSARRPATSTTILTTDITNLNPIGGNGRASVNYVAAAESTTGTAMGRLVTALGTADFGMLYVPSTASVVDFAYKALVKADVAAGNHDFAVFVNGVQLKGPVTRAAPVATVYRLTLGTKFTQITQAIASGGATTGTFNAASDSTTDAVFESSPTIVAAGTAPTTWANPMPSIPISLLSAGWNVIEVRYQASANIITAKNRTTAVRLGFG